MNFAEFFILLRCLLTKEDLGIKPSDENFSTYLAMRYVSFVHPNMCVYVDEVVNDYKKYQMAADPKNGFEFLKAILPKLPYRKINYIKKPITTAVNKQEISDEELKHLAELLEISKREVLLYISIIDNLANK